MIVKQKIILLIGKSGSGKNYLVSALNLKNVISHTTRSIRKNEINGQDKYFHNIKEVNLEEIKNKSIAYTFYNNNHYWAEEADLKDKNVYIIDVKGIDYLINYYGCDVFYNKFKIVYLNCSWIKRLIRLIIRDNFIKGIKRFIYDLNSFNGLKKFDYIELKV